MAGAFLSILMFLSNAVFVHSLESNLWHDRRAALAPAMPRIQSQLKTLPLRSSNFPKSILPPSYGSAELVSVPATTDDPTVIHIQDIHLNGEAQKNISAAVSYLIDQDQADVIALEGAFGPVAIERFQSYPHRDALAKACRYMFENQRIAGPLMSALLSQSKRPVVIGVDDEANYESNVNAFLESRKNLPEIKRAASVAWEKLAQRKRDIFNESLKQFDDVVARYHRGDVSLGDYIKALAPRADGYPQTSVFIEALSLESTLNFEAVETERARMLAKLSEKLSSQKLTELMDFSLRYRAGEIRHAEFYRFLQTLGREYRIEIGSYPTLNGYLKYVALADSVHSEKFFAEQRELENERYEALTRSDAERKLWKESRGMVLMGKLLEFSLTQSEWQEYRNLPSPLPLSHSGRGNARSFERFYIDAQLRDRKMGENLLKTARANKAKTVVLVTGGFHANGIEAILKKNGVGLVRFTPKLTRIDNDASSDYLGVFAREKTPLEKLVKGDRLFLSPKVWTPADQWETAAVTSSEAYLTGLTEELQSEFDQLLDESPRVVSFSAESDSVQAEIENPVTGEYSDFHYQRTNEGSGVNATFKDPKRRFAAFFTGAIVGLVMYAYLTRSQWSSISIPTWAAIGSFYAVILFVILVLWWISQRPQLEAESISSDFAPHRRGSLWERLKPFLSFIDASPNPANAELRSMDEAIDLMPLETDDRSRRLILEAFSESGIASVRDLSQRTKQQILGLPSIGPARLRVIQDSLREWYGVTLEDIRSVPPRLMLRAPTIDVKKIDDPIAACLLLYNDIAWINMEIIRAHAAVRRSTNQRQGQRDKDQVTSHLQQLIDEIVPFMTVLSVELRQDILDRLTKASNLLARNNISAANWTLTAARERLSREYIDSYRRKLDRARQYMRVKGKVHSGPIVYELFQGYYRFHAIDRDGRFRVPIRSNQPRKFAHLWQLLRSINDQTDTELTYLERLRSALANLKRITDILAPFQNSTGTITLSEEEQAAIERALSSLPDLLRTKTLISLGLAQQGVRTVRDLYRWGDYKGARDLAVHTESFVKMRLDEVEAILFHEARIREDKVGKAREERDNRLKKLTELIDAAFPQDGSGLPVDAEQFRNVRNRLINEVGDDIPEPEFHHVRELLMHAKQKAEEWRRAVRAADQPLVFSLYKKVRRDLEWVQTKLKNSAKIHGFVNVYRRLYEQARRDGLNAKDAADKAYSQAFDQFLHANSIRRPIDQRRWWYRLYPHARLRFLEKHPQNDRHRVVSPTFKAFILLSDLMAVNKIQEILAFDFLVSRQNTPEVHRFLNTVGTDRVIVEDRNTEGAIPFTRAEKQALRQAVIDDARFDNLTVNVEEITAAVQLFERRQTLLSPPIVVPTSPLAMTSLWASLVVARGGNLNQASRWAFLGEEGFYSALLLNTSWFLAIFGFVDPTWMWTIQLPLYLLSAFSFGFSHDRLYVYDKKSNTVIDTKEATWRHKLLFTGLGALFRGGFVTAFFLPPWYSVAALALAVFLHWGYNKLARKKGWFLATTAKVEPSGAFTESDWRQLLEGDEVNLNLGGQKLSAAKWQARLAAELLKSKQSVPVGERHLFLPVTSGQQAMIGQIAAGLANGQRMVLMVDNLTDYKAFLPLQTRFADRVFVFQAKHTTMFVNQNGDSMLRMQDVENALRQVMRQSKLKPDQVTLGLLPSMPIDESYLAGIPSPFMAQIKMMWISELTSVPITAVDLRNLIRLSVMLAQQA